MNDDTLLLRRFADEHDEEAFTKLVRHHLLLVHGTALRRVGGDAHLAQDVVQTVFISLAQKAAALRNHDSLAGWLYVSTLRATAEIVRREQRRKSRETSAYSMNMTDTTGEPAIDPASLRPLLDDTLVELKSEDREAVVLRFFAQRSFAEIGSVLRITEEAARKRVDRALEKLHAALSRRGITSTVTALGSALSAAGVTSAPATLASQIAATALAQIAILPAASLASTLVASLLPASAIAAAVTGLWTILPQQSANTAMANEIAQLESTLKVTTPLKLEVDRLSHALELARTANATKAQTPVTAPTFNVEPTKSPRIAGAKEVSVGPKGTLEWEGAPVRLEEFLALLVDYKSNAPRDGSQIIIKANGARIPQVYYVLVEARKAGITSLVLESDSEPEIDPRLPTVWF